MLEIWKPIKGYENYMVSSLGNVKSLNYNRTEKEQILKPGKDKTGYLFVWLCKEGIRKKCLVHRLVAETFIDNPNNLPCVNHKDENKQNNCLSNLEFCSYKYNSNYGTRNERTSKSMTNNPKRSTPIKCLDLETNKETIYPSINEAARQLNGSSSTAIYYNIYKSESPYKNRYFFSEINIEK